MSRSNARFVVIGLDCAPPQFVFDDERFDLPVLRGLMRGGQYGVLRSCDPPITVPAWQVMCTGRDPGALGVYGFRNRKAYDYAPMRVATARDIEVPRVWDRLGESGIRSAILGVPQTFPPSPINGKLIAGLLTPDTDSIFTYPPSLDQELKNAGLKYIVDVEDFRVLDRDALAVRLFELLSNRFAIARHLASQNDWRFFMMVEIGLDRLHHGFWRYADPSHPQHEPGHRHWDTFRRYYEMLDSEIGNLLELMGRDVTVLVASDHGAKAIHGAVRINQWLVDTGRLVLRDSHPNASPLDWSQIDWSRTQAWSAGGYYARIFLNVVGREPEGIIAPKDYDTVRSALATEIAAISGRNGLALETRIHTPESLYAKATGVPPDLLVYFDDLRYRAVGTVNTDGIYANENDTGPDDANHAMDGMYILHGDGIPPGVRQDADILDVTPTILNRFGVPSAGLPGRTIAD